MKKLALIINPIAGMGGSVGLKGTDNVLEEAISRGAKPQASAKVARAFEQLLPIKEEFKVLCCAGVMGEDVLAESGFEYSVVYQPVAPDVCGTDAKDDAGKETSGTISTSSRDTSGTISTSSKDTTATISTSSVYIPNTCSNDTIKAAQQMADSGADIIAFAGGDGTARNIYDAVGETLPVLGIPAGVKIHSPVYAMTPEKSGELLSLFLRGQCGSTQESEVIDINEEDYRRDVISTKLYGYLQTPFERRFMQGGKAPSPASEKTQQISIAASIAEEMEEGFYYIVGPGSTTRTLMEYLHLENTLLGVDVIMDKQLVAKDVSEREILNLISKEPTTKEPTTEEQTSEKFITEKPAAEKLTSEKIITDNRAAEKLTSEKIITDNRTAEKLTSEKIITDNRTTEKLTSEKIITDNRTTEKLTSEKPAKLIITPTGGQGYLLGRGNQQISPQVIKQIGKKNIIVVATTTKLAGLGGQALLVDTGDEQADKLLRGYVKVITDYHESVMYRVE